MWYAFREYDAHKRRLANQRKMTPPRDSRIYEQIKKT